METTTTPQANLTNNRMFVQNTINRDAIISNGWFTGSTEPLFVNNLNVNATVANRILILEHDDIKAKYSTEVYRLLYKTYESIGGIDKGTGFKNENDMIYSIPIWRLRIKKRKIISVMMFKINKNGKKMVAYASTNQLSPKEKKEDFSYMLNESYAELSDAFLVTILKMFSRYLHFYVLKADHLMKHKVIHSLSNHCTEKLIPDSSKRLFLKIKQEWPGLLRFCYIRKIGNENKLKLILGTPNISLTSNKHLAFQMK